MRYTDKDDDYREPEPGVILGVPYEDVRYNDDTDEYEYYITDCCDWMTKEEIQEWLDESDYWVNDWAPQFDED